MVQQRLGHADEAKKDLADAVNMVDRQIKDVPLRLDLPLGLPSWLDYLVLRCEAEAVILYEPIFPEDPFAY
jgi:hypothetical protein